ncbi:MAG: DUF167 domain-containing protein [Cyanobacteria bacterium SIG30]|nr:DUF167 domain-containing protein [Cyanobacteria bacterium SIG30]
MSNELEIEKIKNSKEDVKLNVKVIANAKKKSIEFQEDGSVKLKVIQIASDGRANKEIIEFLCKIFDRPKNKISIIRGELSSHKVILIEKI